MTLGTGLGEINARGWFCKLQVDVGGSILLRECNGNIQEQLQQNRNLLFDSYIPANGTYLIVKEDGSLCEPVEIELIKKWSDKPHQPLFHLKSASMTITAG